MIKTWHRFRRLNPFERRIVLEAAAGLTAVWIALRIAGFNRCKAVLERTGSPLTHGAAEPELARVALQIARLESSTARNIFPSMSCLEQSLVLCWMLRRRWIGAELHIGARKEADQFEAHAWVEWNATVLNDEGNEHRHFVPFESPVISMESQTR